MRRARIAWLVLFVAALGGGSAPAGPHANGVLIAHLNPDIEYTSTVPCYAGESALRDCRDAITEGPVVPDRAVVWFVLASFDRSPGPVNLAGVDFGFGSFDVRKISFVDYGSCFVDYGSCSDRFLEIPTDRWPGPREGTSLAVTADQGYREDLTEIYWFASYIYEPVAIELTTRPDLESELQGFASKEIPPIMDEISDFGRIGFGEPGYNPCGSGPLSGACCIWGECRITGRDACESQGGIYQGDNTDCFPDPCEHSAIETTWGLLKKMYD